MDILDEIRFHMQVATDARRTLICEPDRLASVQTAVDQLGAGDIFTVKPSPVCPEGKLLVLDEQTLEASWRQTIQRAVRGIRDNGLPGGPSGSR